MSTCQQSKDRVVEYAAKRAAPSDHLSDTKGRDRDDYRQLFALKSWMAGLKAPDHGTPGLQKWKFTAVRNQLRSYHRELSRQPEVLRYDLLDEESRHAPSFERKMEFRDALQKLQKYLGPGEAQLLVAYATHGYSLVAAWNGLGRPTGYRNFCNQLRVLQAKCIRFFLENCPNLVPKSSRPAL